MSFIAGFELSLCGKRLKGKGKRVLGAIETREGAPRPSCPSVRRLRNISSNEKQRMLMLISLCHFLSLIKGAKE